MSDELRNYDAWKEGAFDPPYMRTGNHPYAEEPPECPDCGETFGGNECECGYVLYEPDEYDDPHNDYDRVVDQEMEDRANGVRDEW